MTALSRDRRKCRRSSPVERSRATNCAGRYLLWPDQEVVRLRESKRAFSLARTCWEGSCVEAHELKQGLTEISRGQLPQKSEFEF